MMTGKFTGIGSFFVAFERVGDVVVGEETRHCFALAPSTPNYQASMAAQCAAIEIFLPRAGHFWSGLLGMSFTPSAAENISVQVNYGETNRSVRSRLIAESTLEVGMDQSFVSAVERGVRRKENILSELGGGVLLVDMAAQNAGSSEYVFEILASTLCSIISGAVPVDQVSELLENEFFQKR